jgi:hypothetical protein
MSLIESHLKERTNAIKLNMKYFLPGTWRLVHVQLAGGAASIQTRHNLPLKVQVKIMCKIAIFPIYYIWNLIKNHFQKRVKMVDFSKINFFIKTYFNNSILTIDQNIYYIWNFELLKNNFLSNNFVFIGN